MKAKILFSFFFLSIFVDFLFIGPHPDWRMLPAALVGWYMADLASGLVHMYMDYRPCIPGTGLKELYFWEGSRESPEFAARQAEIYARISPFEKIVYDFKKHHPMPDLLGRHSMLHLMKGPVFVLTLPLSIFLNVLFGLTHPPGWLILGVVVFVIGASMTQAFHGQLHRDDPNLAVRVMRRLGLLMSRKAHNYHHDTLTNDFSVISGWSNPLVNVYARFLLKMGAIRPEGLEPT
jgi:hypothetical protein